MSKNISKPYHTVKTRKFLTAIKNGATSLSEAVRDAGFKGEPHKIAWNLMQRPHIRSQVKEYIEGGNYDEKIKNTLHDILDRDLNTADTATNFSLIAGTKLKAIQEINKIQGNYAPLKTEEKKAHFKINLPLMDSDEDEPIEVA